MDSIEVMFAQWQPEISMLAQKEVPGMTSKDVEQELLMAFIAAYRSYVPDKGPFENYVRVYLKNCRVALLRYAYSAGRNGIYTFSELFGENDDYEWKLETVLGIQEMMTAYDIVNWREAITEEAERMSAAHCLAVKMLFGKATMSGISTAAQTSPATATQLIGEVLEAVKDKYISNNGGQNE